MASPASRLTERGARVAAPSVTGASSIRMNGLAVPPVRNSSSEIWPMSKPSWATASQPPISRCPGEATPVSRFTQADAPMTVKQRV